MRFHIITIFPKMFDSYLEESILGRAVRDKKIKILFYNPMDFCKPKERVDGRPYGGGPGMVLRPEFFLKSFSITFQNISNLIEAIFFHLRIKNTEKIGLSIFLIVFCRI